MGRWQRQVVIGILLSIVGCQTVRQQPETDPVVSHFKYLRQAEGIYRQQQTSQQIVCTYTYTIRGSDVYDVGYSCKHL